MKYIYPVVSRRSGGVSVGVNLNPNNACNWRCIYCQVPELKRGAAPVIDLARLDVELRTFLQEILYGDFMQIQVPSELRRITDIALSGNGEPTSAKAFEQVIELIGRIRGSLELPKEIKLVLITNGSLIDRDYVQAGLRRMSEINGEVWFKLDSVTRSGRALINNTRMSLNRTRTNLQLASSCVFFHSTLQAGRLHLSAAPGHRHIARALGLTLALPQPRGADWRAAVRRLGRNGHPAPKQ